MRRKYAARAAVALVAALALAGCSDQEDQGPGSDPSSQAPQEPGEEGTDHSRPEKNLLEWEKSEFSQDSSVTNGDVEVTVAQGGARATVTGVAEEDLQIPAGNGRRITSAFLGSSHAVVVAQDKQETRPQQVRLLDLETGEQSRLGEPAPGPGGPWAMFGDTLAYATYSPGSDYCLATYDLATGSGEKGFCADQGEGFSNLTVTPHGTSIMSFDDRRPVSCRTLVTVEGTETTEVEGVPECQGWQAAATADGHVWASLPNENQIEVARFHATVDGEVHDLGRGSASTLVWCGNSAYFGRDSTRDRPAQLLRWTPDHTLEIVYESPGNGPAFLTPPTCGEDVLTVTAYAQGGDERVRATVPG